MIDCYRCAAMKRCEKKQREGDESEDGGQLMEMPNPACQLLCASASV